MKSVNTRKSLLLRKSPASYLRILNGELWLEYNRIIDGGHYSWDRVSLNHKLLLALAMKVLVPEMPLIYTGVDIKEYPIVKESYVTISSIRIICKKGKIVEDKETNLCYLGRGGVFLSLDPYSNYSSRKVVADLQVKNLRKIIEFLKENKGELL